jgi:hypothetical protein
LIERRQIAVLGDHVGRNADGARLRRIEPERDACIADVGRQFEPRCEDWLQLGGNVGGRDGRLHGARATVDMQVEKRRLGQRRCRAERGQHKDDKTADKSQSFARDMDGARIASG